MWLESQLFAEEARRNVNIIVHLEVDRLQNSSQRVAKMRLRLPPRINSASSALSPRSNNRLTWESNTGRCQPLGKNEESVPNSRRRGPRTFSDRRSASRSSMIGA